MFARGLDAATMNARATYEILSLAEIKSNKPKSNCFNATVYLSARSYLGHCILHLDFTSEAIKDGID